MFLYYYDAMHKNVGIDTAFSGDTEELLDSLIYVSCPTRNDAQGRYSLALECFREYQQTDFRIMLLEHKVKIEPYHTDALHELIFMRKERDFLNDAWRNIMKGDIHEQTKTIIFEDVTNN